MKKSKIITISIILASLLLSMFVLFTPIPNSEDESVFNTKIAIEHIAEISREPHSVFDPVAHEDVRLYLKEQLEEYVGASNVTEYHYDSSEFEDSDGNPIEYDIDNLLAVIPGNSDTAILIVAHYDSRGHIGRTGELGNSYGAADDGYGLAVLLEIARLYGDRDLENTIYILMTDGEETGLFGASKAAEEPFMDNVGFVINIEARGVKGPAYMFETSVNNDKVIDFYKNADLEVSYSLATAVYTVMPNSTDFTEFLAVDKQGVNFAVLNGLFNYHTPYDNLTYINPSSIEHYGVQIIPMIEEFTTNEIYSDVEYFVGDSNQVFFTFLPGIFISYGEGFGTVLHILFFVVLLVFMGFVVYKKQTTITHILKALGISFGLIVVAVIDGSIVARIIAFISKVPYNLTYVRTSIGDIPSLLTLVCLFLGSLYLYNSFVKSKEMKIALIGVGAFINLLLAVVTGLVLSGASFLFLIPGFSGIILVAMMTVCRSNKVKKILVGIIIFINILIITPILYSLYLALTIGGLLALGAILVFYIFVLVPAITISNE